MVYVVQEQQGKNILPALKYGEISVLLPPGLQIGFSAGQIVQQINAKLSNFSDADYLLLIGDPVAIGVSVAVAGKWNQGKVKMLKWDKQEHMYYPVSINFYEKEDTNGISEQFA
jgi:hypothetical protein